MENTNMVVQTYLHHTFTIGDGDFTDVVCQDCAEKFAKERGLEWRGGHAYDSFTEPLEGSDAHAQDEPTWALGESDYPYSCCGYYLQTNFTREGEQNLKSEYPKWVQELYRY
ncbi:MAG: hypothetical protein EBS38_01220 [Actinobacteria bacterium]|nr:hypothetical protein [Actinomycetota bacterium]